MLMKQKIENFFSEIKERLSIDIRIIVFEYSITHVQKKTIIDLKISEKNLAKVIKNLFILYFKEDLEKIEIKIFVLPDKNTTNYFFGIANSSFVPVYNNPTNRTEQVTQVLLGETFTILEESRDKQWYLVKLHNDSYIGWVSKNAIAMVSEKYFKKWIKTKKVMINVKMAEIKYSPDAKSENLREASLGISLPLEKRMKDWVSVLLPDEKIGWISSDSVKIDSDKKVKGAKKILKTARMLLGVSYLWGGRSSQGIDCSGLVQLAFGMTGYFLPRDANLQFKEGIDIGKDFKSFEAGDLLFFGENPLKPTHVGIYTGEDMIFIHSSGFVKYGSLDKTSEYYDDRLAKIFIGGRRLLKN
jgi:gamma-D-glutamyl-L-lysine dipeptidyl-peptidase